jgi:c-di-GMP-binding flagellar brake protein YcgR
MKSFKFRNSPRQRINAIVGETRDGKYFSPLLSDISETGIYLEYPPDYQQPRSHDSVVELFIPEIGRIIWTRCREVRKKEHDFFKGRGLSFLDISAMDRQSIRQYIDQRKTTNNN